MEFYLVFSDRVCLLTNTVQLNHITFSNVPTFRLLDLESDKTGLTQCGYWNWLSKRVDMKPKEKLFYLGNLNYKRFLKSLTIIKET